MKEELCFNWQDADWRLGGDSSRVSAEAGCHHVSDRLYLMLCEQVIEESLDLHMRLCHALGLWLLAAITSS